MEWDKLKPLADKYLEGETTPAEEAELKSWLAQHPAPEGYEALAALMQGLGALQQAPTTLPGFEASLLQKLTVQPQQPGLAATTTTLNGQTHPQAQGQQVPAQPNANAPTQDAPPVRVVRLERNTQARRLMFMRVAAAVTGLLLVGTIFILNPNRSASIEALSQKGAIENPEKAYLEAKKALLLVSAKLNQGGQQGKQQFNKLDALHQGPKQLAKLKPLGQTTDIITNRNNINK